MILAAEPTTDQLAGELNPAEWLAGVEQALSGAGHRATLSRHAVLAWIAAAPAPFTAEMLVAELAAQRGMSSRPTIYRTIDWLRSSGWIARVQGDGPEHAYARLRPGHYHHAVCTGCGLTLVFAGCDALVGVVATLEQHGFVVHGHRLEVYGRCARCRPSDDGRERR